jgi:membrane-bound metal-dependent hydrolase YbcI (DUF457 family)
MPVTPFHFAPGALLAQATRSRVSFLSFCAANVLIDVESLYNMVTRQPRIHTFLHTYVGATLAAVAIVALFFPARWLAVKLPQGPLLSWRRLPVSAVVWGALLGAWSHVLLDSVMHADIRPLAPFTQTNALHLVISLRSLHEICIATGVLGFIWWLWRGNAGRAHP